MSFIIIKFLRFHNERRFSASKFSESFHTDLDCRSGQHARPAARCTAVHLRTGKRFCRHRNDPRTDRIDASVDRKSKSIRTIKSTYNKTLWRNNPISHRISDRNSKSIRSFNSNYDKTCRRNDSISARIRFRKFCRTSDFTYRNNKICWRNFQIFSNDAENWRCF